jgi:hypothetical protein
MMERDGTEPLDRIAYLAEYQSYGAFS